VCQGLGKNGNAWHELGAPYRGWTHYVHKWKLVVMYPGGEIFIGNLNDVCGSLEIDCVQFMVGT
jgi:hypothetical protein